MKRKLTAVLVVLLFVSFMTSTVLTSSARGREVEHVTIAEAVMVSGTLLKPDTYTVEWNEPGPTVQVSFMKGHKTMAVASATLVTEKSPYDRSVEMKMLSDNTRVLERISFKHRSLIFAQG
jgi:hypothetical protein